MTMLTMGRPCTVALLCCLAIFGQPNATTQDGTPLIKEALRYQGRRITNIEFQPADQPLTSRQLMERLPFKPGSIFEERDLRRAIQNLFASGRFSDLAVDASEAKGGVALKFITRRAYFVGRVLVTGVKEPPNNGQLASATKLRLGTAYSESGKNQAIESVQNILRQNGFYNANIDAEIQFEPNIEQANVFLNVDTGPRARFDLPVITGSTAAAKQNLIRATHWKRLYGLLGWQDVTEARLRQGLENIRRYYEKRDLLQAKVTLKRLEYSEEANTVRPFVDIEAGSRIVVRVEGASIGRGRLSELVPIFQEGAVDPDLLVEGQHNLEQYMQALGYLEAKVTYTISQGKNSREQIITYRVNRGPRHKFVFLSISGNRYFLSQAIRERLYIQPAEFPRFPHGRFSEAYLKQDVQSIENLYQSNGFRDVKVTTRVQDNYGGATGQIGVFISIKEGPQWLVSNLSIEGAGLDLAALQPMLASAPGQPYSEINVSEDRDNILNYYFSRGFLNAAFEYYAAPAEQPDRMNVRYVINPGVRKYVRDVLVSGLDTTRPALVYDRIELKKDQPLSLTAQTDSQRRLYDLGIFARVNTAIQNPDGEEDQKYVLYDIDEARHYSFNAGVGAQIARIGGGVTSLDNPAGTTGFAPRLSLGISRINFLGLGQTVGLQTSVSTIEQRASLAYFIPQFVSNENLSLTTSSLIENSNDIRTFTAHRREASIQLGQKVSRAYTVQYRLVFRHVTLSNVKIDQLLVPLLSQPETIGLAEVSLIQDKRDDPADAHRGIYSTVDLSYAPGVLGQTHFARALFRNSTYHPFRRELVFARSTQFGFLASSSPAASIPLAERIYSGGSTSIRAFPDFQAGPRDFKTGFPLGGNALFINNFELRFPLYGDNLNGVLFHDAGNVYSSLSDISFRFRQRNLQDFNYVVQDVGIGVRYRTPIGPLRLDFSFSPDAPRFFGLKGTEQDLINGTAVATVQKINSFQFHFSLGQAF
ncbi:MAG TPA: BamA/TamA family outer membrane protein [Bryobacteraceae bacterium]|nr:BamA/TamA family outer membrane protein [Bryobacteraceae bacterium]